VRYGKTEAPFGAESLPRNEGGRGYRGAAPIVILETMMNFYHITTIAIAINNSISVK